MLYKLLKIKAMNSIPEEVSRRVSKDSDERSRRLYKSRSQQVAYSVGYSAGAMTEYLRFQEEIEIQIHQINDLRAEIAELKKRLTGITEIGYRYYLKLNTIAKGESNAVEEARGLLSIHDAMFDPNAEKLLEERGQLDQQLAELQKRPQWVKASEAKGNIHAVTMRLAGTTQTWFGTLEFQMGKIVGPRGNIFDPEAVEYLLEETPLQQTNTPAHE